MSTELKERIARTLRDEVAPVLDMDGAGIEVLDVTDGIVRLRVAALCGCCPSSIMSAVTGLEQELRKRIPEVEYLELEP